MEKANKKVSVNLMADFVILFCQNLGVTISAIKLQKLLYYVQAWHIAKFDKEILFDTLPEAWANGPVYREVYNNYKTTFFKNENIVTNLEEAQLSEKLQLKKNELDLNTKQLELIMSVLDLYSKLSDERLVLMTHSETPWNEARKGLSPIQRCENKLAVDTVYNYFNRKN